jgi:hypothetical protein
MILFAANNGSRSSTIIVHNESALMAFQSGEILEFEPDALRPEENISQQQTHF